MKIDTDIHNYYEHLVLEKIDQLNVANGKSDDYLADLTCLALNQLPPRYIRYEVDMAFYLPNSERHQMDMNVESAVKKAVEYLSNKPKESTSQEPVAKVKKKSAKKSKDVKPKAKKK